MLITGIVSTNEGSTAPYLISSILNSSGRKVSIIDLAHFLGSSRRKMNTYMGELQKNEVDILLFKIHPLIPEMKELCETLKCNFDIMIYLDKADDLEEDVMDGYRTVLHGLLRCISEESTAIVNMDNPALISLLQGMKCRIVTFGYNLKASLIPSSTGDAVSKEGFMCCQQRAVLRCDGKTVEPQEYRLPSGQEEDDPHELLAVAAFVLVNGIDLNNL